MKRLKDYSSIWNVEHIIYALNDVNLPFPLTLSQISWFVGAWIVTLVFKNVFPLVLIDNTLMKHIVLPAGIAWIMSQKTFDGMKPLTFICSVFGYIFRPHMTCLGEAVRTRKLKINENITIVRSGICEKV